MQRFCTRYPLASITTPPSLLFFMPCVTACLGTEQQPRGETRGEDFNLTAESFPIGLTVITERMILFMWLVFVMQPCGGREYFPDRIRCFSQKVRGRTENHTCDHSDYPERSGLQLRGKVTLHRNLQKCHLSIIFGVDLSNTKGDDWHFATN